LIDPIKLSGSMELARDNGFIEIRNQFGIGEIRERLHAFSGKAKEIEKTASPFASVAREEIVKTLLELLLEGFTLLLRQIGELFPEELLPIALDRFVKSITSFPYILKSL
jgi:hypothetical protein